MAGRVVLLDIYAPYFAAVLSFVCGIPRVTLTGTVDDWRRVRTRIDAIADLAPPAWCRSLAQILDHFVRAAEGDADTAFWRRIYNPVDAYGGRIITGWAARFYPYLESNGTIHRPNPLLDLPIDEPRNLTTDNRGFYKGPGIVSDKVPAALSRVVVTVNDQFVGDNRVVALHGGLVGVAQDGDGALRPVAGWHLTPAAVEIDDVLERIVRDHVTTQPEPAGWRLAPAELVAVYRRIGSARLFGGAWRLLPEKEHRTVWRGAGLATISAVIDLSDGRSIAAATDHWMRAHWVVCTVAGSSTDRLVEDPDDIPVYGTSLAILLDAALDSGGDIAHLETGRLADLDRTPP